MRYRIGLVLLLSVALASGACVSRNVESIDDEEAESIEPPAAAVDPSTRKDELERPAGQELAGVIEVAPEIADRVPQEGVLFLVVRVAGREGGAPLRVRRIEAASFPRQFTIGESDSMMPGTPLVDEMSLEVRVDQDGDAFTTDPGDVVGRLEPVSPGSRKLTVVLDRVITEGSQR